MLFSKKEAIHFAHIHSSSSIVSSLLLSFIRIFEGSRLFDLSVGGCEQMKDMDTSSMSVPDRTDIYEGTLHLETEVV